MTSRHLEAVDKPTFMKLVAAQLDVNAYQWSFSSNLVEDCGMDSLDHYEILCSMEQWTGSVFADELVLTWETFEDLYRCYRNNISPL